MQSMKASSNSLLILRIFLLLLLSCTHFILHTKQSRYLQNIQIQSKEYTSLFVVKETFLTMHILLQEACYHTSPSFMDDNEILHQKIQLLLSEDLYHHFSLQDAFNTFSTHYQKACHFLRYAKKDLSMAMMHSNGYQTSKAMFEKMTQKHIKQNLISMNDNQNKLSQIQLWISAEVYLVLFAIIVFFLSRSTFASPLAQKIKTR